MSRRNVLKTASALGLASTLGLAGTVAARPERKGNNFGRGNGLGAFLNEAAEYKPAPVWNSGVVDMTGRDAIEIVVGAVTSIDLPDFPPEGPFAFSPQAVTVSPGTEVTWVWGEFPIPIPHDVVSLDGHFDSGVRAPGGPDFTHTFDEVGTYLYYCTPHGAPFPVHPHGAPEGVTVYNEFGMRGAVLVADE